MSIGFILPRVGPATILDLSEKVLLTGPAGSGKTHRVLGKLTFAVQEGRTTKVKLIVPTASMAEHLQHTLARGRVTAGGMVTTLADFVRDLAPAVREPGPAAESWLLDQAVERADCEAFRGLSSSRGLRESLANTVREFWAAGCRAADAQALARDRYQKAFATVFSAYETLLSAHSYSPLGEGLRQAAATVRQDGLGEVRQVFLDGFVNFSSAERELVAALAETAEDLLVTLPDQVENPFPDLPREVLTEARRPPPARTIVRAKTPEHEIEDIARRILAGTRPFHDHGLILRSPEVYAPIVRVVFDRFRIPYRMRFPAPLSQHGAVDYLRKLLGAIAEGFPGEMTLELLNLSWSPLGQSRQMDAYDFFLREKLPGAGLDFLLRHAETFSKVRSFLEGLQPARSWAREKEEASAWTERIRGLRAQVLCLSDAPDGLAMHRVLELRSLARAIAEFDAAADQAAELLGSEGAQVKLEQYLEAFDVVLLNISLHTRDQRRNVVHVLSVYEARQWELPSVFVCGLVEKGFPRHHAQDLFFPDNDRRGAGQRGIRLRTTSEREKEERFLFSVATTRATSDLVLTYPEAEEGGKPLVRSFFLDQPKADDQLAEPIRLREDVRAPTVAHSDHLNSPRLGEAIESRHPHFSPSGVETYLQCPYRFFAQYTLDLEGRPAFPERRIDNRLMGSMVHRVLSRWTEDSAQPITAILEDVFDDTCRRESIKRNFRTAVIYNNLRTDLERFADEESRYGPTPYTEQGTEVKLEYVVDEPEGDPIRINARIDRFEIFGEDLGVVVDYKYSTDANIKKAIDGHGKGRKIQAALYLSGLQEEKGVRPAGMRYWGLRKSTTRQGWLVDSLLPAGVARDKEKRVSEMELQRMLQEARTLTAAKIREIRRGRIKVDPDDRSFCRNFCEYRDICRVRL